MEIKILSPLWGHEHLPISDFLEKIRVAGYHGIDTWIPDDLGDKLYLYNYLRRHDMVIVTHQHGAAGNTFKEFCTSFVKNLYECAVPGPLLINSHTGRDWFSNDQNLALIDIAAEFSDKMNIPVVHETHRGRLGFSPQMAHYFFDNRESYNITADFSHWTCVTESLLENFAETMTTAISRTRHVHARIGFENGPQVPDPRDPEWNSVIAKYLGWWDRIVETNKQLHRQVLTFTTEFGPRPYMPCIPFSQRPVADQFEVNCFMMELLVERYNITNKLI
jgi:sugar phosphate isomerase/epimerase